MSDFDPLKAISASNNGISAAQFARVQALAQKSGQVHGGGADQLKAGADSPAKIREAATQFESLLLHQMFKAMWETVPKDGMLSSSKEEELYRDFLNEALAKSISENRGIGVREVLEADMTRQASRMSETVRDPTEDAK